MKLLIIGCAVAISGLGAVPVMAKDATVSFSDLDLSRPNDLAKLERRVDFAARAVCHTGPRPGSLLPSHESVECHREATAQAGAQIATAREAASAAKLAVRTK